MNLRQIKYDADQIIGNFELKRNVMCGTLKNWVDTALQQPETLPKNIEKARLRLDSEGDFWNEEELKMHFLSPLFIEANLDVPEKIKLFYERSLNAKINGETVNVVCDSMLATPYGINIPKTPFFFLQEFKKSKNADDAEGQMLIAMLIAQVLNNNKTIYGAYLQGKLWTFATLNQKQYCVSRIFDATQPDELQQIMALLKHLKTLILNEL
jgi:hypothetical protein